MSTRQDGGPELQERSSRYWCERCQGKHLTGPCKAQHYCEMCDEWVKAETCPMCGAATLKRREG